ncbi:MAG TPA: bifunctional [glutamine synthetase] adenylyltransferase/[glutamine synthetase]-adenylyl-L-tyrosine phosphorylase [Azospirillaceae bacterium]|nr:bifunctional [glutamine synthetase] adenylyltransferase/[glutamine synthetase]-adenylyl-L-tyrosine phosphorylase [Azospirillaceae bacterium]
MHLPFDPSRLPAPSDHAEAARGFERWQARVEDIGDPAVRDAAAALGNDPDGRRLLDSLFGNSPYLGNLVLRDPAFLIGLLERGFDAAVRDAMAPLSRPPAADEPTEAVMVRMRTAKAGVALSSALADIVGAWSLETVTGTLSALAEQALDHAAAHLLRRAADAGDIVLPAGDHPCRNSGLIILGMGKLGARELNYSSDIDVIVLYDEEIVRSERYERIPKTFIRLARDLVRMMEERTAGGYVFRTDLRLRPDPAATPLAVSVGAAVNYYGSLGQNWERAAMIKARPVAGDIEAGKAFLNVLRPFVWRRHLDFAAIQDIHSIKRQINAHRGHRVVTVNGHDVKVGRGGIREIEFFAQTQQLIFGGRDPALRCPATLPALDALVTAGRVARTTADDMAAAYRFLRQVEHRLQMVDDRQTHSLPADDAGVDATATFLGYGDPAGFRADLKAHLHKVETHYAALFEEAPDLGGPGSLVFTGTDEDPETIATLSRMGYSNPSSVAAAVRGWHHGRYRATRSQRARELLTELGPALLQKLAATPNPDLAFNSFDAFLGGLPAGVQILSLFYNNPRLLELVADILGTAPRYAQALARRPTLLDAVLEPGFFGPLPGRDELRADIEAALGPVQGYEEMLDAVRRWTVERQFRVAVQMLRGVTDGEAAGVFLSDVADLALAALLPRVEAEMARRHGRCPGRGVALLALGRLGERRMSIQSDLDLIVVYDASEPSDGERPLHPSEYYIRFTQRLVAAITALTAEGRLYEVDMRLRPSGNKGPLAVSLEAFAAYQTSEAWTWEHQALTRARVIAGPPDLANRIGDVVRQVLTRRRDPDKLIREVADMRRRIDAEFGGAGPWNPKYRRGGLIDAEFVAQYLVLRHAADHPALLRGETVAILEQAAAEGLLPQAATAALVDTVRLWRRVQGFLRLTTEANFDPEHAPEGLRRGLARAVFGRDGTSVDFAEVEAHIAATADAAFAAYKAVIDGPADAAKATESQPQ